VQRSARPFEKTVRAALGDAEFSTSGVEVRMICFVSALFAQIAAWESHAPVLSETKAGFAGPNPV
jgi:hypothetical protein